MNDFAISEKKWMTLLYQNRNEWHCYTRKEMNDIVILEKK